MEQFKPMFFEEPVPPDNLDALKEVKDRSPVAISAGERLYTRWDYKNMFDKMAADYIQPDISHAGGIMELYENYGYYMECLETKTHTACCI